MRYKIANWFVDSFVPFFFPRVNPAIRWLLKSRTHWIVSWYVVLLVIRGRRSGRIYEVPIAYHRDGSGRFEALTSPNGNWWKNLRGVSEIDVYLGGRLRRAGVELVENDELTTSSALGRRDLCRRLLTPIPPGQTVLIRISAPPANPSG